MDTDALFKLTVLTSYYFIAVLYFFYYIDTSVSLENIPLVKFIKKLHPGPEWFIFYNLTREFIDDVIWVISLQNLKGSCVL